VNVKTLATLAVLAAVGIGLYIKINNMPEPAPPPDFSGTFGTAPAVDMGDMSTEGAIGMVPPAGVTGGGDAPVYIPPPGDTAPAFNGGAAATAAPQFSAPPGPAPEFNPAPGGAPQFDATLPGLPSGSADPFIGQRPGLNDSANVGAPPGVAPETFAEVWRRAQQMLQRGELADAHLVLSDWYFDQSLNPGERAQLTQLLSQLAGTVVYSRQHLLEAPYIVQTDGKMLDEIARQYKVPADLLARINGVDASAPLRRGTELKVLRGPFSAIVDANLREMVLMVDGRYAGRFPVALGQDQPVVQDQYVVNMKRANPTYFGPGGNSIAADDPNNPYGEHYLGLVAPNGAQAGGFGIHGTHDPASLARNDPRGFVRLAPQDAEDAFDILSEGSTVIIRR
jgi:hypothetical protein